MPEWIHTAPSMAAAFLASGVEFVEALTVILAVGTARGWRSALAGAAVALAVLAAVVAMAGPALTLVPLAVLQTAVGLLLLLFGLRWLRKAILRGAGIIPLHDEAAAFDSATRRLRLDGARPGWDPVAFAASAQIVLLEGMEVVFIVLAIGAGNAALFGPAVAGAIAALLVTIALGIALHRPLTRIPENTLKFAVGVVLSAFGTFWVGEGLGMVWPGGDLALPALSLFYLLAALLLLAASRARRGAAA